MATPATSTAAVESPRRLRAEVLIVLGLSLGQSAIFAIWRIVERELRETPLRDQTATLNPSASQVNIMDLVYQVLRIGFSLVPVALALYLLSSHGGSALDRLGLRWRRGDTNASPARDLAKGVGLAALIGVPGLGLYLLGRELGVNVQIQASGLNEHWWTLLILVMAAIAAAALEEVVVVGYLVTRLREMTWGIPAAIAASAVLRGTYHLYQGYGMAVGNVVMGVLFAWFYVRYRRVMPLVIAHATIDIVGFVGYAYLPASWLAALGLA